MRKKVSSKDPLDELSEAQLFCTVGRALYGASWKLPLARALNLGLSTVNRYAAGERQVIPGLWSELAALARIRASRLESDLKLLSDFARARG